MDTIKQTDLKPQWVDWHLLALLGSTAVWQHLPTSQNQLSLEYTGALRSRCQINGWNWIQVLQPCFRGYLPPTLWAQGDHRCRGREPSWRKCDSPGRGCQLGPDHSLTRWCLSAALQRLHMTECAFKHFVYHFYICLAVHHSKPKKVFSFLNCFWSIVADQSLQQFKSYVLRVS